MHAGARTGGNAWPACTGGGRGGGTRAMHAGARTGGIACPACSGGGGAVASVARSVRRAARESGGPIRRSRRLRTLRNPHCNIRFKHD